MNTDRLLYLYDRVAKAHEAVPRLRNFVLDLAVRGKLVEQDPADEPASNLLKRIEVERAKCPNAKKGKSFPLEVEVVDRAFFDLPTGWKWVPLAAISDVIMGQSPPGETYNTSGDGVPLINGPVEFTPGPFGRTIVNQFTTSPKKYCEEGDLLICVRGSTTGRTNVAAFRACIGRGVAAIRSSFDDEFVRLFIWKARENIISMGRGIAFPSINKNQLETLAIPLPPLSEQSRIVAKVDELMALCHQLDEAHAVREETRNRLTKASYARASEFDVDDVTFRSQARFAIGALPALTARANQVKHLRQTILELAVRGKLVKQDPEDEPPPRLDSAIPHDLRLPFPVPPNWRWSRLRALGILKGGGTPSKARDDFWNGSIFWVSPKDMKVDYIAETQLKITEAAITGSAVKLIEAESILFVVRGMILAHSFPVAISRVPLTINQDMKAIALKKSEMAEYLLRALKGLKLQILKRVKRSSHGTCRIESRDYRDFMIPLPPLAEQHRIVTRVDELMALCDQLEVSLGTVEKGRQRFLESLLREALEPPTKEMNAVVYGAADRDVRATGFRTAPPIRGALDQWLTTGEVSAESER